MQIAYTQVLYKSDVNYLINRQGYRATHKTELFKYPLKPITDRSVNSMQLSASSVFTENIPENMFSIKLALIHHSWTLYAEPWAVNKYLGHDILGARFSRFGLMGRYMRSYLKYSGNNINFQIGRFNQRWGQSWSQSLMFSLYALPFDQASLSFNLDKWSFDMFGGSFSSEMLDPTTKINRHVAGHRISRVLNNNKILIEAGEVVVYTGENRSWDIQYLSPFSIYYIDMFSPSNFHLNDSSGHNNENTLIFFSLRWNYSSSRSFYGEFLLDDFQVDDKGYQNKLGWKIGSDGIIKIKDILFTYEIEYSRINSWSYLNRGQFTNFENLGHSVGYPYGPDNHVFSVQFDSRLSNKTLLDIEYAYIEKGMNTLRSVSDEVNNRNTTNDSFPRPPVSTHNLLRISVSWLMQHGKVEFGWSNHPFANHIAYDGEVDVKGSLFLKFQGHYTFTGF